MPLLNEYRASSDFKGGQSYTIPDPGDRFKLGVWAPFGGEKVTVYASEQLISIISMDEADAGLKSYWGTLHSLNHKMRANKPVFAGKEPLSSEFYEGV